MDNILKIGEIFVNTQLIHSALSDEWWRGSKADKPSDCLYFDRYCIDILEIKKPVDLGLFGVEAALKAALKPYVLYVILYTLHLEASEIEDQENLEHGRSSIAELVDANWQEFYERINIEFSRFLVYLSSDDQSYS